MPSISGHRRGILLLRQHWQAFRGGLPVQGVDFLCTHVAQYQRRMIQGEGRLIHFGE